MAQTQLIKWLNDAHAMEKSLIPILKNHAKDASDYPDIQAMINQHIEQTERHAQDIKNRIEQLGGKVSRAKTIFAKMMGAIEAPATGLFKDDLIKNLEMDYAAEHFEMASYASLIAAAEVVGDTETAQIAESILSEEEAMADWIFEHLPQAVASFAAIKTEEDHGTSKTVRVQPSYGERIDQDSGHN